MSGLAANWRERLTTIRPEDIGDPRWRASRPMAGEQPATLPADIELHQRWAKQRIEELSDRPPSYSTHAYTSRRTTHVAFKNGYLAIEGGGSSAPYAPGDMVENLVANVRAYRNAVSAPQLLVWRCEPEFTLDEAGNWHLYARLCFETDEGRAA